MLLGLVKTDSHEISTPRIAVVQFGTIIVVTTIVDTVCHLSARLRLRSWAISIVRLILWLVSTGIRGKLLLSLVALLRHHLATPLKVITVLGGMI